MKRIFASLIFIFSLLKGYSTSQIGDILIYNKDTMTLFSNPLELRNDWEKLSEIISNGLEKEDRRINPKKYQEKDYVGLISSACWRGYVAEWQILNKRIYLSNIYACHNAKVKLDLRKIFKESKNDLVLANWINGNIFAPSGSCIEFNNGYNSIYEKEFVFDFKNGELIKVDTFKNSIIKESKCSTNSIYSKINWGMLPDLKNKHIRASIGIQPDKNGLLDSIIWENTYMLDDTILIINRDNVFIKEAIRIVRLIQDWDVIYQRNKIASRYLMIFFDDEFKNKYAR
jgi:hypothetical protein